MGHSHRIYVTIDNHHTEHQATVIQSTGVIHGITLSILIDPGATGSFISPNAQNRCELVSSKHDNFSSV